MTGKTDSDAPGGARKLGHEDTRGPLVRHDSAACEPTEGVCRVQRSNAAEARPGLGRAPGFVPVGDWYNSEPFSLSDLRGRVVLVNFWVHSCVNCHNSLPTLRRWYEAYASTGFEIVGVHTPEFESDKDPEALAAAIERDGVRWPVFQDNAYATWDAYNNRAWPTFYLLDRAGGIRAVHTGEISERFPDGIELLEAAFSDLLAAG